MGARARGFKWFDGQGGASVASENAALGNLSAWRAAHAAKLIVLERQGLAKLVSDRLKHLSSQRGVDAVPTHCRDASCAARVSAQRVTLDAGALETQLDAGVRRFSALLNWARAAAAFDDILYIAYGDLVADPERELRRAYRFLGVDEARGIARAECAPRCANGFRTRSSIVSIDTASDRDSIGP